MNNAEALQLLKSLGACAESREWAGKNGGSADELLAACPSEDWLAWIVCNAPDAWREKAAAALLARDPSEDALRDIVIYAPDAWADKARQELKGR